MVFLPHQVISMIAKSPRRDDSTLSANMLQISGTLILALTAPLVMAYPNTATGVASRHIAYITLGLGEVLIIPGLLVWLQSGQSALSDGFLLLMLAALSGTLAWRVFCGFVKPEWMGITSDKRRA